MAAIFYIVFGYQFRETDRYNYHHASTLSCTFEFGGYPRTGEHMKRFDPLTHRYPRTIEEAFQENHGPIEWPHEPSLLKWWADISGAVAIVLTCIIIVKVVA
jgi:hypothetical protein